LPWDVTLGSFAILKESGEKFLPEIRLKHIDIVWRRLKQRISSEGICDATAGFLEADSNASYVGRA